MFKEERLIFQVANPLSPIEKARKKQREGGTLSLGQQRLIATTPVSEGGEGFGSLRERRSQFKGGQTGGLEDKITATEQGAGELTTETNVRGDIFQIQPDGTRKLIKKGARTPLEETQERSDELRETLKTVTDAGTRDILQAELKRLEEAAATPERLEQGLADIEKERGALRTGIKRREEEIRTGEGEAGERIASQVAAARSAAFVSPEAPASSTAAGIRRRIAVAGGKTLSRALSADPSLQQLRNRITTTVGEESKIEEAQKKISEGEFAALKKFFTDLEEEEATATETANERLNAALTEDALIVIADNPALATDLITAFPESDITFGEITARAAVAKRVSELASKKTLSRKEELELEKLEAEIGQIGIKKPTAPTAAVQDFEFFQELQKTNPEQAEKFADLKGFGGKAQADKLKAQLEAQKLRRELEESAPTPDNVKQFWSKPTTAEFGEDTGVEAETPGLDILANQGTSVPSPIGGDVIAVTPNQGALGNNVTIKDAQGNTHRFSHLSRFDVGVGEQVILGQSIGGVGNSGTSLTRQPDGSFAPPTDEERAAGRGSHLDYRVKDADGNNIDPKQFIIGQQKLSKSQIGKLKIQVGKAAFGTRISNEEGEKVDKIVEDVIKENPNLTIPEIRDNIIDDVIGFTLTDNIEFGNTLKENLILNAGENGLSGVDARGVSRLINDGKLEAAMTKVENIAMRNAKQLDPDGFIGEPTVKTAIQRATELTNTISGLEDSPIGVVTGTLEEFLGRLKGKEAQNIKSQIVSQVAAMRNRLSGTAVTESEERFLEPLIPKISDSPANFMIKLNQLKRNPLVELNNIRDVVGLPALDDNTLLNRGARINLFRTPEDVKTDIDSDIDNVIIQTPNSISNNLPF